MNGEPHDIRIIRLHKRCEDRYRLLSQLPILLLFTGVYVLFEQSGLGVSERAVAFVLLALMLLATAMRQAVGLGVARAHMLLDGIGLDARSRRDADPRAKQP